MQSIPNPVAPMNCQNQILPTVNQPVQQPNIPQPEAKSESGIHKNFFLLT